MSTNDNTLPIAPVSFGGWHLHLALYRAALAAGFTVSPIKEFEARDGVAWSTTLSLDKKKVINASNGGHGGPDELDAIYPKNGADMPKARAAVQFAQAKLMGLPEVEAVIRAFDVTVANFGSDKEKIQEEIARIMAAPARKDDEAVGYILQELAALKKMVPKLRKKAETKLMWVRAGDEFPDHIAANCVDTPANRIRVQGHHKETFIGFQGFAVDLLAGL